MMFNRIEKSGTGIEKSGTGIEKSGTGIEKSGTGIGAGAVRQLLMVAVLFGYFVSGAAMADAKLLITEHQNGLVFSMHHSQGVLSGFAPVAQDSNSYAVIPLYSLLQFAGNQGGSDPLVVGSGSGKEVVGSGSGKEVVGSGSGKEVVGSGSGKEVVGSGSGKEVVGSGSGKEVVGSGSGKDVVGSGSGSAGEQCFVSGSLLVVGSGSGKEVVGSGSGKEVVGSGSGKEVVGSGSGKEVVGSGSGKDVVGSGSGKDVVGSGSGAAGELVEACSGMQPWGVAEVAFDADGASVVVHQFLESGTREHVVAFLPAGSGSDIDDEWESDRGFVLTP